MKAMTGLEKMAFDAAIGKASDGKSVEDVNQAVRNAVTEACGGEWNYYNFMDNQYKVFAIIAEIMPSAMASSLANKYDAFAEFRDLAMGDSPVFWIEDNSVYEVATTARGNSDVSRQKIVDKNFTVPTARKAIKLYDEFDRFMAGKITIERLVEKANTAMSAHVGQLISNAINGSYSALTTNYKANGAFDADTLVTLIAHVKAATGADSVEVWGSNVSLSKVDDASAAGYSDAYKDRFNNMGYFGTFRGTDMFELPQAYKAGEGQEFATENDFIVIVPAGEKIVKVVFEGDAKVDLTTAGRNDEQMEFSVARRVGVAALTADEGRYGIYDFGE